MITISLRFEENMKKELDDMCDEMGMNLTTFFMIYAKKVLRDRRIPFDIAAPSTYAEEQEDFYEDTGTYDSGPPGKKAKSSNSKTTTKRSAKKT